METLVPQSLIQTLKKQKYHMIGRHSAVKRCRWFYETLIHNRPCYKQKFYGIKTHQCIQMTPALFYCTQQCLFCWRAQSGDLKLTWNETKLPRWDPPELIVEESIKAQLKILSGYKGNPKANKQKFEEASNPRHVAISLTGEPTLYGPISDLIKEFHRRNFTTFLVSNGTLPTVLAKLDEEPTQLYISACAPDKETFKEVCRPQIPEAWEKLNATLELLSSFKCPTVIRITSVKGLNMKNVEGYAKLIDKASPTYIEPKAYMHVGFSRLRLGFENMPSHQEIRDFAQKIAEETGYNILDEAPESRVVLLSKLKQAIKFSSNYASLK
ncbi:MAG: 4-demethylwyosine synthase TYW1 [Candidatus Bathyarchaeia archaeon]